MTSFCIAKKNEMAISMHNKKVYEVLQEYGSTYAFRMVHDFYGPDVDQLLEPRFHYGDRFISMLVSEYFEAKKDIIKGHVKAYCHMNYIETVKVILEQKDEALYPDVQDVIDSQSIGLIMLYEEHMDAMDIILKAPLFPHGDLRHLECLRIYVPKHPSMVQDHDLISHYIEAKYYVCASYLMTHWNLGDQGLEPLAKRIIDEIITSRPLMNSYAMDVIYDMVNKILPEIACLFYEYELYMSKLYEMDTYESMIEIRHRILMALK